MEQRVSSIRPQLEELLHKIRNRHTDCIDLSIGPDDVLAADIPASTWGNVEMYNAILRPFYEATVLMSESLFPTLGMVGFLLALMANHMSTQKEKATDERVPNFFTAIKDKLDDYKFVAQSKEAKLQRL